MRIVVTGSIATDHLMRFPARFADQIVPDRTAQISLSLLVDELVVRRGGVAANIAFGLAQLGLRPTLVGAVGHDFADYRSWLQRHGVDCSSVLTSQTSHTARFVCTTDVEQCQIASFYPGAMTEAARIDLGAVLRADAPDLVIVGPDDPAAMLRHARTCRRHGIPFAADPSQQLARMSAGEIRQFIDGADYLLTNEYELSLLCRKAAITEETLDGLVRTRVTTLGSRGVRVTGNDVGSREIPAAKVGTIQEPTGAGDGFRAGFFAGLGWGLSVPAAARVGCQLAAEVLETVGTQEYTVRRDRFCSRLCVSYGALAAAEVWRRWPDPTGTPTLCSSTSSQGGDS